MLMFVRTRFARRGVARGAKRSKVWVSGSGVSLSHAASSLALFTIVSEADLENLGKPTIARMRGRALVKADLSVVPPAGISYAFGIALIEKNAFAIGATAVPGPLTSPEFGWIDYHTGNIHVEFDASDDLLGGGCWSETIDSKAMRKVVPGHVLAGVFETGASFDTNAMIVNFMFNSRILLMPS